MTSRLPWIVLFTDFGLEGPYIGQVKAVLLRQARGAIVIDLFSDLPPYNAKGAAYLLAAYSAGFPAGAVFLCVVDPGVGSDRKGVALHADGLWFVGPDNGLFEVVARRAKALQWWDIEWRPEKLSASFHGRDLFAPVAARLARGEQPPGRLRGAGARIGTDWPDDLAEVVYMDRFGNVLTGLRASVLPANAVVEFKGQRLERARTFSDVAPGTAFWYENANGLVEIAVNQGRADRRLGAQVGDPVAFVPVAES